MNRRVAVVEKITKANDRLAEVNRALLARHKLASLNLMSSPGAGKTTLVERTVAGLAGKYRLGVVEGDLVTSLDAERAAAAGAESVQINTGGSCHLDAGMVGDALGQLPLADLDLLIVENVGNLICPATFDLGTDHKVVVASVPEGDDKPFKYPTMYRGVDVLIINKIDLLPYVTFDMDRFRSGVAALNENVTVLPMSCRTGEGLDAWLNWLGDQVVRTRARR
ncbi:MAG TPA: hydrogenase nickel incorporation protein HypB [Candidatus Krumholzibacteria bacterium]|nr:hydrogenase nickel incorporation protein HypB [Candidatus Krumholzibacteria bacterium]HPD70338.1 hydrogenase nickel incorporation protein HypB [Candidatus Krumholzibacteria bacterium]HRY39962.1 hydrogenase nickel incorporation protein HypB [Candidatus Krumholzibacteria bacterium]